jgi:hypothetical protein
MINHAYTQGGEKRLKGVQFAFSVVTGTIAFSLGKKVGRFTAQNGT